MTAIRRFVSPLVNFVDYSNQEQNGIVSKRLLFPHRCLRVLATIALGFLCQIHGLHAQAPALLWHTNVGASLFAVDEQTNLYANTGGTVIKLNGDGVPLETNTFSQFPGMMQRDADGNFYLAGVVPAFFNGTFYDYGSDHACFLAKYTAAGALVWSNRFGPTGLLRSVVIKDLRLDSAGDVYAGFTYYVSTTSHTSSAAKFDTTGSNVWTMEMPNFGYPSTTIGAIRLGGLSQTQGYALTYVAYYSSSWNMVLSRFDSNGNPTRLADWSEAYGPTPPLITDSFGDLYTIENAGLTKRDPVGNVIWQRSVVADKWPVGPDFYGGVHTADSSGHLSRFDKDGNPVWTLNLPSSCLELFLDASGDRFLSLSDGAIGRIGNEILSAPSITNAPQPLTVLSGSDVVFSVGASGFTPLRYFWFFNDSLLSGHTNAVLDLPGVTTDQAGYYYVIVSNLINCVTSAPVQLRVKSVAIFSGDQLLTNGTYTYATNPVFTIKSAFTGGSSFYTLDGSQPSFSSTFYSGPFTLSQSATVRAIGYSADFYRSEEADTINAVVLVNHVLTASSSGGGSVNLNPPGGTYVETNVITATAVPDSGWMFLYWLGDTSGTNSTANISMERDKSIYAVFGTTLSTTVAGSGQILLSPPGGLYAFGRTVRLTAVPQSGSYFGFWGNAVTGNTNPLYFTVTNPNPTISSIFGTNSANQAALTVLINGNGRVKLSPQGNVFSTNQTVTLTGIPNSGANFQNWSGDASGVQNPFNLSMYQSRVVTANFTGGPSLKIKTPQGDGFGPAGFRFTLSSDPDSIYEIFASTNLVNWQSLGLLTNTFGEAQVTDISATNSTHKFYKALP